MVDSVFVPAGSSLVIEPGCVLKAKYHEQVVHRASLNVYGQLTAVGTEEDSIYFNSENNPGYYRDWFGLKFYHCNSETSIVSHSVISNVNRGVFADNSSSLIIEKNTINQGEFGVFLIDSANISINDNNFQDFRCQIIWCENSRVEIDNNFFYNPEVYISTITIYNSNAEIKNNILNNANCIYVNMNSEVNIFGNIIINSPIISVFVSNGSYATIMNNTICCSEVGVHLDYYNRLYL